MLIVNFFDKNDNPICSKLFCKIEDAKAWARIALQNNDRYVSADFWLDGQFYGTMIKGANV